MSASDLMVEELKHHDGCRHEHGGSPPAEGCQQKDFAAAMRRSPSVDSLANVSGVKTCVCAPTTHAGSFRCRLHRNMSSVSHAAAAPLPPSVTAAPRSSAPSTSIEAR